MLLTEITSRMADGYQVCVCGEMERERERIEKECKDVEERGLFCLPRPETR
jgi:hypothetical protein